jgi:uncharacterized protein (DUF427 family)
MRKRRSPRSTGSVSTRSRSRSGVDDDRNDELESNCACPHGVQFYDAVIDGARHKRVAWNYEEPRPSMKQVTDRFGFWEEVEVR